MRVLPLASLVMSLALPSAALAVVGGGVSRDPDGVRRHTVRVESSRGTLCSGTVIGRNLVLTAAHCVQAGGNFRVIALDARFRPRIIPVASAAPHRSFLADHTPGTQPGVDLAVIRLAAPLPRDMVPVAMGPLDGVANLSVAGFGVGIEGRRASARVLRQANLRGAPFAWRSGQNRAVVAIGQGAGPGNGACVGDSGGPILAGQRGSYRLVGIVSWASGVPGRRGYCGGLTAATPVADHLPWIGGASGGGGAPVGVGTYTSGASAGAGAPFQAPDLAARGN